ncbi:LmbE family N-acetylglucosaminyl deacetylase [Deinococcus sp. HSC-46F16]|uniref:hypothetical protein n=1 Tax=Deinococcus sp. HSC-46F16 TaxID=2910968 RepID=UPI003531C2AE|nr:LmbE family N-acetylglucosaminyl deacetylase [Deinococcus sp. HSC-46F16]
MLSPYPDDETLCCAGTIQRARAAAWLGVPPERTWMLGYPDGGLLRLLTTLHRAGAGG